jgi:hypothetical protein
MALTITQSRPDLSGRRKEVDVRITADSSYPAGGYSYDFGARHGIRDVDQVVITPSGGYLIEYDYVNKKIKFLVGGAAVSVPAAEVAAATNLSAIRFRVYARGR